MTRPIVLAAGGTGGHVFPAKALAETLLARGRRVVLITDRRGNAFEGVAGGALEIHRIRAAGVAGRGLLSKVKAAGELVLGYLEARRLIRALQPAVVIGFGGYASVPTVMAAGARGVPVVLHEQNAVLGRANRLLAPRADAIATSFETVEKVRPVDRAKLVLTGNPVRDAIRQVRDAAVAPLADGEPIAILVTGGSQGASVFADLVPAAIALLPADLRARLRISQQAREAELDQVVAAYRSLGVDADVRRFFDDMPARLAAARLLICRSGASTVAENTVAGRPALLIPYPHAIDDHQTANARAIAAAGGARVLPQSATDAGGLAAVLVELLGDPPTLTGMTAAARRTGVPDAVDRLADLVERQAGPVPAAAAHTGAAATTASTARRAAA